MQYLSKIYLPFKIVEDKVPHHTRVAERALIVSGSYEGRVSHGV